MNAFRPGVQRPLDPLRQKLPEALARRHIVHIAAVRDFVAVPLRLRFVFMVDAVKAPV